MAEEKATASMMQSEGPYARRLAQKEDIKQWYWRERASRTVKALERHGFTALFAESREKAREAILNMVPAGATVGAGGSITVRELGLLETLEARGHTLYDHWKPGLTAEEVLAARRAQLTCDVFLTSVNAMTSDGQLVSCDAMGNRVCAMTFGPRKVIVAVGANKITNDLDSAMRRVKEVAAPQALRDLVNGVPCVQTGSCQECDSPQRACGITLIMERRPSATDITVVVVGEPLGF